MPLTRYLLKHTSLSVVALTSKTSSRIQDDILSDVEGGPSDAMRKRLTVVPNVDLLKEQSVETAAKQIEGEKALRLLVCLAGEVGQDLPRRSEDIITSFITSYILKNLWLKWIWRKRSIPFNSIPWAI